MDIHIVNTILRLCSEQQTCLFEVTYLCDYCLEQRICTNSKLVLPSIRNYMEIFKISRDRNRIEFYMPVRIGKRLKKSVFHFKILFSLKSVEVVIRIIHVRSTVVYVQNYTCAMIIFIQVYAADLSIVPIHIV